MVSPHHSREQLAIARHSRGEAQFITALEACPIIRVQSWDVRKGPPVKAEQALGLLWPRSAGEVARGQVSILCIGPTDWLVLAPDHNRIALCDELNDTFARSTYRATDVSDALARIQVEGDDARALLAKGCSLDLHADRFPPLRSARTRFAGMPVVIYCAQTSTFECIVARSYRDYLLTWLADAGSEFDITRAEVTSRLDE